MTHYLITLIIINYAEYNYLMGFVYYKSQKEDWTDDNNLSVFLHYLRVDTVILWPNVLLGISFRWSSSSLYGWYSLSRKDRKELKKGIVVWMMRKRLLLLLLLLPCHGWCLEMLLINCWTWAGVSITWTFYTSWTSEWKWFFNWEKTKSPPLDVVDLPLPTSQFNSGLE